MADLYKTIMRELAGDIGHIAREIGTDEETAGKAVATAVPLMLGAMSRQASTPDGARELDVALETFRSLGEEEEDEKGFLGNLASMMKSPIALAAGTALVGRMFGGSQGPVEAGLSRAFSLGGGKTSKLLAMVTPVVFDVLRRHKREKDLDAQGMASMLRSEEEGFRAESEELDGLMGLLDRDDDGSVMDGIAKMGAAFAGAALVGKMFKRD